MINNHLSSKDKSASFFGFDHLHQVTINAKHDLEDFLRKWELVVSNMQESYQNPDFLRPILYKAIKDEPQLSHWMNPYAMWWNMHSGFFSARPGAAGSVV